MTSGHKGVGGGKAKPDIWWHGGGGHAKPDILCKIFAKNWAISILQQNSEAVVSSLCEIFININSLCEHSFMTINIFGLFARMFLPAI